MIISVVTKPNMYEHETRRRVLEALAKEADCKVVECQNRYQLADDTDIVLVFGGDGTVLDVVRTIAGREIAVIGVNLGNMGFLTAFEQDAAPNTIVKAIKNGKITSRMLLGVKIGGTESVNSLNEVVIKTAGTRPITLEVTVDGNFVDSFHSDGIIISSPAGSTAYSLSAGGPVLAPDVDAIVINPICAHSLHSRPLVVNSSSEIKILLSGDHDASVSIDGGNDGTLKKGETVIVSKSHKTAKFICSENENFYGKLLNKMNRWGITSV